MWQKQPNTSSYRESIKSLEADIQHANSLRRALLKRRSDGCEGLPYPNKVRESLTRSGLAANLPQVYSGDYIQMRLSYSPFAPLFLYLIEWLDCTCTDSLPSYLGLLHILVYKVYVDGIPAMSSFQGRKATLKEFYAVIYPSLRQLEGELAEVEANNKRSLCTEELSRERMADQSKLCDEDLDRDDECSICMETRTKIVLPDCGHSMCTVCFHDWNSRSQSCPFCRGSLKRVSSEDLWIMTSNCDVVDTSTLAKENFRHFYLYIENLPLIMPETHLFVYDYLI